MAETRIFILMSAMDPQLLIDSLSTEPNRLGPIGKKYLQDCGFVDCNICRVECSAQGKETVVVPDRV